MKRIQVSMSILIVTAAISLAAPSVQVTANIPFEFVVGTQTMPAGEYTVSSGSVPGSQGNDVLLIESTGGGARYFALALRVQTEDGNYPQTTKLMFRRYGNQYFLSQVWTADSPVGREFPESRTERELTKSAAVKPQTVIVLAQGPSARKTVAR